MDSQTQQRDDEQKRQHRQQWQQAFAHDSVDLTGLPTHIVLKARKILQELSAGKGYYQFQGKRFRFDRTLISIPVTYSYRLLCREQKDGLLPLKVLSHEQYNAIARNRVAIG
ncbi:MAG: hypothetical protein KME45_08440 [Stenomitos rutilans HA7619-LM2]|jgi:hypothetical protein|nr:hypothetical protein [Stenomitos rutilans HA7619-LM2]